MNCIPCSRNRQAFNVLELMVVMLVLAVLMGLLIPAISRSSDKAHTICCNCNLKQVGLAFRIWSGDNGDRNPMAVYTNAAGDPKYLTGQDAYRYYQVLSNELNTPVVLVCPVDGERKAATNFTGDFSSKNLSYFVGVDADEKMPSMFLAGDRNITNGVPLNSGLMLLNSNQPVSWTMALHKTMGNVALADGSVQQFSSTRLKDSVAGTGTNLNRLLFSVIGHF